MNSPKSDTLPPGPAEPRTLGPDYTRPASVKGLVSLRELRNITGIGAHDLSARMKRPQAGVEYLESLDLELLEVLDLVAYVQALGMTLTISVDLNPNLPLKILHTTP